MKCLLALLISVSPALADEAALTDTQSMLTTPSKRQEVIKGNADAQKADQAVKSLFPDQASQEAMYGLSAEIMQSLEKETGGDPEKMQELLKNIAEKPERIEKLLTPAQLEKIKALGQKAQPVSAPSLKK